MSVYALLLSPSSVDPGDVIATTHNTQTSIQHKLLRSKYSEKEILLQSSWQTHHVCVLQTIKSFWKTSRGNCHSAPGAETERIIAALIMTCSE